MKETIFYCTLLLLFFLFFTACKKETEEIIIKDEYTVDLLTERAEKDFTLRNEANSPFNRDPEAVFSNLKYFDPDTNFIFRSKLFKLDTEDTVTIMGTRGEQRKAFRVGYVVLNHKDAQHKLNVYKSLGSQGQPYYSIWFTDETSGNESYHIGRYLDFKMETDEDFIYTIDMNRAYNPYCAYSELFTCPIPTEDDHLNFSVLAGEKNFK